MSQDLKYSHDMDLLRKMLALEILIKLEDCGFTEEPVRTWNQFQQERVFSRAINDRTSVKVYTSIVNDEVRNIGKDAIRVCATYRCDSGSYRGLVKDRRVNRVGSVKDVVGRMHQRMRDVWRAAASHQKCHCGAPKFTSKKGNLVCAEACWTKK